MARTVGARRARPDIWRFSLRGDADAALSITDGMTAEILRGDKESVGKAVAGRDFKGGLAPATIAWRRARSPATTGSTMKFR